MGLDVCAVTKYKVIKDGYNEDFSVIFQCDDFTSHLGENLSNGMVIDEIETDGEFRCGYGHYSYFRDFLASLAYEASDSNKDEYLSRFKHISGMYDKDVDLNDEFVGIIHFSDCEGVIGNELCKVLDVHFDKYMDKASESEWFEHYKRMAFCIKKAAESGGYLKFY